LKQLGTSYRFDNVLSIHLTDVCNEKCIFCVVGIPEFPKDTIKQDRIEKILVENSNKGYREVNLHGGEPTVFSGFFEIVALINSLKYPSISIQTNGQRMKDLNFTRRIKELNVNLAVISLHSNSAEEHDWMTQSKGGFSNTVQGIKNALKVGMVVRTNTVITSQNIEHLPEIVDFISDLGVKHINISNIHPVFTAYKNFELVVPRVQDTKKWVTKAVNRALDKDLDLTLEGFPFCLVPEFESHHIETLRPQIDVEMREHWISDYFGFMDRLRTKGEVCDGCKYASKCGGVYYEYIEKRGWKEFEDPSIFVPVHES
jgi:MoaA/NifB/PqqE/SkfB family radical SAM enzyme